MTDKEIGVAADRPLHNFVSVCEDGCMQNSTTTQFGELLLLCQRLGISVGCCGVASTVINELKLQSFACNTTRSKSETNVTPTAPRHGPQQSWAHADEPIRKRYGTVIDVQVACFVQRSNLPHVILLQSKSNLFHQEGAAQQWQSYVEINVSQPRDATQGRMTTTTHPRCELSLPAPSCVDPLCPEDAASPGCAPCQLWLFER